MDSRVPWVTPSFWWRQPPQKGWRFLLAPLACLWRIGGWLKRQTTRPEKAPFPVISVGNLVMGGAGKTPTILALAAYLKAKNLHPIIVLRGYKGRLTRPTQVNPQEHNAQDVGDEALLIAQYYPTYIARQRKAVLPLLQDVPPSSVILLDDGHQHTSLVKDLSLVVIDGTQQFGNEAVFPAGPLRETAHAGLKRADGVIVIGKTEKAFLKRLRQEVGNKLLLTAVLTPSTALPRGTPVVGVAGIGYPQKFLHTLQEMGLEVKAFHSFPDHYVYPEEKLRALQAQAADAQALLVTTQKDWVRLPAHYQSLIQAIGIELLLEDLDCLARLLKAVLPQTPEAS